MPVFKNGDRMDLENYRGMYILSSFFQNNNKIIHEKLKETINISDGQQSFRTARSCIDAVL